MVNLRTYVSSANKAACRWNRVRTLTFYVKDVSTVNTAACRNLSAPVSVWTAGGFKFTKNRTASKKWGLVAGKRHQNKDPYANVATPALTKAIFRCQRWLCNRSLQFSRGFTSKGAKRWSNMLPSQFNVSLFWTAMADESRSRHKRTRRVMSPKDPWGIQMLLILSSSGTRFDTISQSPSGCR